MFSLKKPKRGKEILMPRKNNGIQETLVTRKFSSISQIWRKSVVMLASYRKNAVDCNRR